MSNSMSVHSITDRNNLPFSKEEYSKFKFGCKSIARKYGEELANITIKDLTHKVLANGFTGNEFLQIVVISSPYQFIPTAAYAMKDYFVRSLNNWLAENNLPVVQETKITRSISYREDYGALSAEERMNLIGKDTFYVDREFVKDKYCLFLDDIRITGSHEKVIQRMVDEYELECDYSFLYYAQLDNSEINPNIENELNYAFVSDNPVYGLPTISKIIRSQGGFLLNTRTVKYILNSPHEEFFTFIDYQSNKFLETLYHQAIGNSYHLDEHYSKNMNTLKIYLNNIKFYESSKIRPREKESS